MKTFRNGLNKCVRSKHECFVSIGSRLCMFLLLKIPPRRLCYTCPRMMKVAWRRTELNLGRRYPSSYPWAIACSCSYTSGWIGQYGQHAIRWKATSKSPTAKLADRITHFLNEGWKPALIVSPTSQAMNATVCRRQQPGNLATCQRESFSAKPCPFYIQWRHTIWGHVK